MSTHYILRKARRGEAEAVAAVEMSALQKTIGQPGLPTLPPGIKPRPQFYAPIIEDGRAFIITCDDEPIGFCAVDRMDEEAYLKELFVAREHQGKGLGDRLLAAAYTWTRAQGLSSLLLSTFADIPWNGPYYARRGFQAIPASELIKPGIAAQRAHEAQFGTDMSRRVFMRKTLAQ